MDTKPPVNPAASNGAALVSDTRAFLIAWRRILSGSDGWVPAEVDKLRQQSRVLEQRARASGVGGLAHHLSSCEECLAATPVDRTELSRRLRNVSELASQLRQELDAGRVQPGEARASHAPVSIPTPAAAPSIPAPSAPVPAAAAPARVAAPSAPAPAIAAAAPEPVRADPPPIAISPPPLLTVADAPPAPVERSDSPEAGSATPSEPSGAVAPGVQATATAAEAKEVARSDAAPLLGLRAFGAERKVPGSGPPRAVPRKPPRLDADSRGLPALERAGEAAREPSRPAAAPSAPAPSPPVSEPAVPVPPAVEASVEPALVVPSLIVAPPPMLDASPPPELAPAVTPAPGTAAPVAMPPAAAPLGAKPPELAPPNIVPLPVPPPFVPQAAPAPPIPAFPPPSIAPSAVAVPAAIPALVHPVLTPVSMPALRLVPPAAAPPGPGGPIYAPPRTPPPRAHAVPMPAPRGVSAPGSEPILADLEFRLERIRRETDPALRATPAPPENEFEYALPRDSERRRLIGKGSGIPWWSGPLLVVCVGAVVVLVLVLRGKPSEPGAENGSALEAAPTAATSGLPASRLTNEGERLRALLSQIHGHGGVESPELADLLDEEAAILARALEAPCAEGSVACIASAQAREVLRTEEAKPLPPRPPAPPLGAWLSGLKLPGIGLKDDAKVRELVEYHTENTVGREAFQVLLFQCGAYQDLIHQLLLRHALPLDLMALAMVESGCVFDAESAVGARGLWQFMPATARAYHLRVRAGIIDERISPTKSTDAALKFLGDLRRKLGSWELAMASYNMGPFGLIARLRQAGGRADFWDLANAGRLPAETAAYVPKVQAFAVILANLERFGFEAAQLRAPEVTSDLEVPPGTRLGLIARAAGSSTTKIRELNPEFLGDSVPDLASERFKVRVPKDGIWRAREALPELLADSGHADRCVPHSFDWGRQRFTKAMAESCEHLAGTRQ